MVEARYQKKEKPRQKTSNELRYNIDIKMLATKRNENDDDDNGNSFESKETRYEHDKYNRMPKWNDTSDGKKSNKQQPQQQ